MSPKMYSPPLTHMAEGEVALRLAFRIFRLPNASSTVTVCLDRRHIESAGKIVFPVSDFLASEGWALAEPTGKHPWLGTYTKNGWRVVMSPNSRGGDVLTTAGDKRIRAECKKGKLHRTEGSPENRLVHKAIGQLMTIDEFNPRDVLLAAFPRSRAYRSKLACQLRPLMRRAGI
jgi:hypothetical protein